MTNAELVLKLKGTKQDRTELMEYLLEQIANGIPLQGAETAALITLQELSENDS